MMLKPVFNKLVNVHYMQLHFLIIQFINFYLSEKEMRFFWHMHFYIFALGTENVVQ